jgi:transmembrane sensor
MAPSAPQERRNDRIRRAARRWALRMADDPERHRAALEAWLARDPAHGEAYRALSQRLDMAALSAARPGFARPPVVRTRERAWGRLALPVAAALALVAALAALLLSLDRPSGQGEARPVTYAVIASADVGRSVRTADGSTLALAPGTLVAIRHDRTRRSVELRAGAARFTVAHDRERPFVVEAGGGTITALGTIFEVADAAEVSVRLLEGTIEVVAPPAGPQRQRRSVRLASGGETRFAAQPAASREGAAIASGADVLSFDNVPLALVLAELNRGAATRFALADPALGRRRIFLDVGDEDAASVAAKLAALLDLKPVRSPDGTIMLTALPQK